MLEHWHILPREGRSLSLEIFRRHLDIVLGNLLRVALLEQGVGPGDIQRSLPTSTILWKNKNKKNCLLKDTL